MKVLVTGSTGFVGRHVVPKLLERGHTVVAVARDETRARTFAWFDAVRFVACDVHRGLGDSLELFDEPDAVIHLAWPGLPNYGSLIHFEENLPAAYRFLKSLVEGGVDHLLVTGTCFEYGMQSGALTESRLTEPANPYGLAKDTLRKFLESLQKVRPFTLQWARLFYMYGPGQHPNSLLAQLDRAVDNREPVFNMSGGEQLRDYLPVEEVAGQLVLMIEHPECHGVIVDLRQHSPTFRQWISVQLSADNRAMLFIPEGIAHGFQTLADDTEVFYQMSRYYSPESSRGVRWDDPAFGIIWPEDTRMINARDRQYPNFVS